MWSAVVRGRVETLIKPSSLRSSCACPPSCTTRQPSRFAKVLNNTHSGKSWNGVLKVRAGEQESGTATSSDGGLESVSGLADREASGFSAPDPKQPRMPFKLIAALAAGGAAITGYLAVEKLTGGTVACPASGSCETILSSGYASVFGIPLSLLGFLAYTTVAGVSGWQAVQSDAQKSDLGRLAVLGGGTALAATSASLLYLLATQFPGQTCTWCLSSALLSFSIFAAACSGCKVRELADLAAPGGLTAAGVILFLSLAWNGIEAPQAFADINIPYQPTIVNTPSSPKASDLARRLKEAGAKMYGAFWCSHCQEQKVAFGREAQGELPYIECFPEGFRQGVEMADQCKAANLEGFPLWVINGQRYEGSQSFGQLEAALKKAAN